MHILLITNHSLLALLARAMALVTAARKVKFVDGILKLKLASLTVKNSPQDEQMTVHKPWGNEGRLDQWSLNSVRIQCAELTGLTNGSL